MHPGQIEKASPKLIAWEDSQGILDFEDWTVIVNSLFYNYILDSAGWLVWQLHVQVQDHSWCMHEQAFRVPHLSCSI